MQYDLNALSTNYTTTNSPSSKDSIISRKIVGEGVVVTFEVFPPSNHTSFGTLTTSFCEHAAASMFYL